MKSFARTGRWASTSGGKLGQPAAQCPLGPVATQIWCCDFDEVGRKVDVAGRERVADRGFEVSGLLVPAAGPPMQHRHVLGALGEEPGEQHVGEQVVVAVPAALVIERNEEQVASFQRLEEAASAGSCGDRVAQGTAQAIQDGGVQQEPAQVCRLLVEHLVDQVVHDEPVVPGEGRDERR